MIESSLSLVPIESLIRELQSRFEHSVFAGIKEAVKSPDDMCTEKYFNGNYTMCTGLCMEMINLITKTREGDEEDDD